MKKGIRERDKSIRSLSVHEKVGLESWDEIITSHIRETGNYITNRTC